MIRLIVLLIVLSSCSFLSPKATWEDVVNRSHYRQRLIPVSSREEAKKVIGNKVNFNSMIFEQTTDPYFGIPRWSEQCLAINKIGPVIENPKGVQSISSLVLNPDGEPGYCLDKLVYRQSQVIYLYCNGMKNVVEIKYTEDPAKDDLIGDLCEK